MTRGPGLARTLLPKGFTASGINCGVRKYRPDLGLIYSQVDAVGAGVYTKNECKAAPVLYSQAITPSPKVRAIVVNSGQANAVTGPVGVEDNARMIQTVADSLKCEAAQVLVASTGVIGVRMDIEKICEGVPELAARLSDNAEPFSVAILTTDLIPKTVSTTVQLTGGEVRITGICKGSGMVHPQMATMLGFLLTDAGLSPALADTLLGDAVDDSFNMISVDGDMSTNDCVFMLANGASGVFVESDGDIAKFKRAFVKLSQILAQSIARDGEGATKLIEVDLDHAPEISLARKAARGLVVSPLIKAAIHGEDPNWGRILARLGAEGVPTRCLDKVTLSIQDFVVLEKGIPVAFDRDAVRAAMKRDTIRIHVDLFGGRACTKAWGCDLSRKYVDINAEYST